MDSNHSNLWSRQYLFSWSCWWDLGHRLSYIKWYLWGRCLQGSSNSTTVNYMLAQLKQQNSILNTLTFILYILWFYNHTYQIFIDLGRICEVTVVASETRDPILNTLYFLCYSLLVSIIYSTHISIAHKWNKWPYIKYPYCSMTDPSDLIKIVKHIFPSLRGAAAGGGGRPYLTLQLLSLNVTKCFTTFLF